jgi:hypothetical protein
MRIGLDLDGVIYHWTQSASIYLNGLAREKKWEPLEETPEWGHFKHVYGEEIWAKFWTSPHVEAVFASAKPYFGTLTFVSRLCKEHDVRVITSRPESVRRITLENWLRDFPADIPSFFFSPTRRVASKGELDVDLYIDDHPYADDLAAVTGKPVLSPARRYNQRLEGKANVFRKRDYIEILNAIAEMERGEFKG